jgi:hypothetical protein
MTDFTDEELERLRQLDEVFKAVHLSRDELEGKTEELVAKCVVCHELLTRVSNFEYRGDPMQMIIGPGGRNQMSRVVSIYCGRCGISYHHLPKGSE